MVLIGLTGQNTQTSSYGPTNPIFKHDMRRKVKDLSVYCEVVHVTTSEVIKWLLYIERGSQKVIMKSGNLVILSDPELSLRRTWFDRDRFMTEKVKGRLNN